MNLEEVVREAPPTRLRPVRERELPVAVVLDLGLASELP